MDRNEIEIDNESSTTVEDELFSFEDLKLAYGAQAVKLVRKKKIILIIDDDFYVRTFLSEILKSDFEVVLAEDGEKGCEMAAQYDPDLILLDVEMPKLDGKEVLKRLRGPGVSRQIPVIIISGSDPSDVTSEMDRFGVNTFITKPVQPQVFLTTVFSIFGKKIPVVRPSKKVPSESVSTPAVLLYDGKAGSRDKIRGSLLALELMTVECETIKQLQLNFKYHSKIFDGVIYDANDPELTESFVIQDICDFLKIPCFSVEEYLKSPEEFEKLLRKS